MEHPYLFLVKLFELIGLGHFAHAYPHVIYSWLVIILLIGLSVAEYLQHIRVEKTAYIPKIDARKVTEIILREPEPVPIPIKPKKKIPPRKLTKEEKKKLTAPPPSSAVGSPKAIPPKKKKDVTEDCPQHEGNIDPPGEADGSRVEPQHFFSFA